LKALIAVLDRAGITGIAANFLKVLTRNRRPCNNRRDPRLPRAGGQIQGEASADVTVAERLSDRISTP
jgi:F-type H+-transporting ATPase subunit delta